MKISPRFLSRQPQLMETTMKRMQVEMGQLMPQIQQDVMRAIKQAETGDSES